MLYNFARMLRSFLFVCLVLAAVAARAQSFAAVDSLLRRHEATLAGRGGGLTMILVKGDKTLFERSLGNFSAERSVPIASASKWYSALLLMTLVHDRLLSLDDRVSKYIPSFRTAEKEKITLRQCFSLTGGFAGGSEELDEFMGDRSQSYAQQVDAIAQKPLVAAPGEEMNYGGLGMQVAGRVCEIAGGKSWHRLFEERVATPLGLKHTYYGGYYTGATPRIAGGVLSCASDYLKLLALLMNGGAANGKQLLSRAEVDLLLSDQTGTARIGYSPFTKYKTALQSTRDPRYAIGNWLIREPGFSINTSPGAFGFTPWIDRARGYYGVIAVRSSGPKVMPVFWEILKEISRELK
jgi:CubicO group peptidase (beta-lactamase class C family)